MQPRLKTSKKWTAFPKEYTEQIESVFQENFSDLLGSNKLVIEGRIYPAEVMLRVGLAQPGRISQANFEASMDYDPQKKDAVDRIHNCIDATASMMMDYFESDGESEFPRTWQEFPFNGVKVYLQFTTENTDLEAQANALLGEDDDSLVLEEQENEDALDRSEVDETLSHDQDEEDFPEDETEEDDEEDEDDSGPRMFGGGKKKKGDMH
ncbi:MAG: hypothetical protein JSU04_16270 [Bdellovibrionales bacterium]|nr:hypothetical protein [Bdellovibrionales bacterium]